MPSRLRPRRSRSLARSPAMLRATHRVARGAPRASQGVGVLPGLQASWGAHATWHQDELMHDRGEKHMAHKGRGIFLVYVDIDAQHDKEFNEWYNTEHLPELLAVPGILAAARYQAVKGGPQYLAFYELENVAVMQTPAFTNRPRTPWEAGLAVRDRGQLNADCRGADLSRGHRHA